MQPLLCPWPVERCDAGDLREVIEDDDGGRQVEHGVRHAERIGCGNGHALPSGRRLVGEVADARGERESRIAAHRLDLRQRGAKHLERILVVADHEGAPVDAGDRVATVSGSTLDALEQEGAARAQAQGSRDRRQGVGRQLDAGDAGWCCGRHRSCSRTTAKPPSGSGTEAQSAVPPKVRTRRSALIRGRLLTVAIRRRLPGPCPIGARLAGPFTDAVPRRLPPSRLAAVAVRPTTRPGRRRLLLGAAC